MLTQCTHDGALSVGPQTRDAQAGETVLYYCKRLWGQPWIAPILALLLHQWLLLRPEAGGTEQRQKHINVLVLGE